MAPWPAIPASIRPASRSYVGWFNARHGRTGTRWEGRFRAGLIDDGAPVLRCSRYIDLNPVRAGIVADPLHWPWSGCAGSCGLRTGPLLSPHRSFVALAGDGRSSSLVYADLLRQGIAADELKAIRAHLQQQRAWGPPEFRQRVETSEGRYAGVRPAHRPGRGSGREFAQK